MQLTKAQPRTLGARVVDEMRLMYGAKFAQQWQGLTARELKDSWDRKLAGLDEAQVRRGLVACLARQWPPTLPEFLRLCCPWIDPETAYHEAIAGISARSRGVIGQWSHPGVFWAAQRVGAYDLLNMGWQAIRSRWEHALRDVMARGKWEPVPPPRRSLAAPGGTVSTREESLAFLREIKQRTGCGGPLPNIVDHRAWARRIVARTQKSDSVSLTVLRMAQRAIAAPIGMSDV